MIHKNDIILRGKISRKKTTSTMKESYISVKMAKKNLDVWPLTF